jgi:uncharacterized membrane protein
MSRYSLLVSLHVASVIVWLGCGTTLAFIAIYAQRTRDGIAVDQLGALARWLTLWILAPASLAAPGFGVLAAHAGHWPDSFFFHVGEGAFSFSFVLTVAIRIPLLQRAKRGDLAPARLPRYLLALALAELTVLYVAVADMVVKPSSIDASSVRYGGLVIALGVVAALVTAVRARTADPRVPMTGVQAGASADSSATPVPRSLTHISKARTAIQPAREPISERGRT